MDVTLTLQIIMVVSAVLMIISVLLQQRGASLGAGFGGSGELYTTRSVCDVDCGTVGFAELIDKSRVDINE